MRQDVRAERRQIHPGRRGKTICAGGSSGRTRRLGGSASEYCWHARRKHHHNKLDKFRTLAYSPGRSTATGAAFLGSPLGIAAAVVTTTVGRASLRAMARSSHLPKIILPAVVCSTDVTEISMVLPIIFRALSTTTMVPSSR